MSHPSYRLMAVAGLAAAVLAPAGAASAAASDSAEVTYSCRADTSLMAVDTDVVFEPDGLPATVVAGSRLFLRGNLAISLSSAQTAASGLAGAKALNVESSSFRLEVSVGGRKAALVADEAVGPPVEIASSTTVTAAVSFPDLAIPADATGELVVSMPSEATADRTVPGAPAKVVFNTVLNQDSLFVPERQLDCSLPDDASAAVVARIPITPASSTPTPVPSEDPTATPPAVTTDTGGLEQPPADTGAVGVPPVADEPVPAQEPVVAEAAPQLAPANAPIPPRSAGRGTFLPTWSLLLTFALVPAGFVLYAARQRKRLQQLIHAHRSPEGTSR